MLGLLGVGAVDGVGRGCEGGIGGCGVGVG
jgi:hypothetical protein